MRFVLAVSLLLLSLLSGCAADKMKPILDDIQHCKRHYAGSIALGTAGISDNATVTLQIDCDPYPPVTTGTP